MVSVRRRQAEASPAEATGLPWWVWPVAAVGMAFVAVPLIALALRVDWAHFAPLVLSDAAQQSLWLSLRTASVSTLLCLLLGVPIALVFARFRSRASGFVRVLVLLPLVLPPVVGGIALLYTFGRRGLIGQYLEVVGVQIAFSTVAVVIAQTFVSLPFLVVSVEGALRSSNTRYETVAATLGARPTTLLRRVTLPLILPALISGLVLSFARALGEFGATLAFAGSLPGVTRTLPLEIYLTRESDADAAVALAFLLVVVAAVVMVLTGVRRVRS